MSEVELSYKLNQTKRNLDAAQSILDVMKRKGVHEVEVETVESLLVSVGRALDE